jgi:hypothetical protein
MEIAILAAWNIWKQRNIKHFDDITPEVHIWKWKFAADLDILRVRVKPENVVVVDHFIEVLRVRFSSRVFMAQT